MIVKQTVTRGIEPQIGRAYAARKYRPVKNSENDKMEIDAA